MHNRYIGSFHRHNAQPHSHRPILRMSVNGASTMFSYASWIIYVPIGCRHLFIRYWQPLLGKTTLTCSLPHPENECQQSVKDFDFRIMGNSCSDQLWMSISQILTAFTGKNNSDMLPAASWESASTERQRFLLRILGMFCSDWLQRSISQIMAACTGKNYGDMLPAASWEWASTERQWFLASHLG